MVFKRPDRWAAVDTESDGLFPWAGHRMFAGAVCFDNGQEFFCRGDFSRLKKVCEDPTIDKVMHNAKHDLRMLEAAHIKVKGWVWDTMSLGHLLDGRRAGKGLSLDKVSRWLLPEGETKVIDEITNWFDEHKIGKDERYERFDILPPDMLMRRNQGDARLTAGIFRKAFPTVFNVFPRLLEQESRLIHVVRRMEDRGIRIDYDEIDRQQAEFDEVIRACHLWLEGVTGLQEFNPNSADHLQRALQNAGILDLIKEKTKSSRRPKMDDYNLRSLHHPVAHHILLLKACYKMRDGFLEQMREKSVNGVLHANFNQFGTTTSRFSCSKPNLQNIPIDGDRRTSYTEDEAEEAEECTGFKYAPHIKRIFHCRPGMAHIHSDKKQAEMFMLGHYANDPILTKLLWKTIENNSSIHKEICQELYHEINKGLTTRTKAVVFGYQYGAGLETMARKIGGTIADAQAAKLRLGGLMPGLPRLKRELDNLIRKQGYVETIHGRRHYVEKSQTYICINRMCQGSVGDELKSRMVALDDWAQAEDNGYQLLLNIHDDLGGEAPAEEAMNLAPQVKEIMEQTSVEYKVPLPSSLDITYTRWADLKEIKV